MPRDENILIIKMTEKMLLATVEPFIFVCNNLRLIFVVVGSPVREGDFNQSLLLSSACGSK